MTKRYFKSGDSKIFYQFTDRPAFFYDLLIIKEDSGKHLESIFPLVGQAFLDTISNTCLQISCEDFYSVQSNFTKNYKGFDRFKTKDFFKTEWQSYFSLKKQANQAAYKDFVTNPRNNLEIYLDNQHQAYGVSQQYKKLMSIESALQGLVGCNSLIDIFEEAREEACEDYCRAGGIKIL